MVTSNLYAGNIIGTVTEEDNSGEEDEMEIGVNAS